MTAGPGTVSYQPSLYTGPGPQPGSDVAPTAQDLQSVISWVQNELQKVQQAQNQKTLQLATLNAPPVRTQTDGLIALADGTNWNPGNGVGLYVWRAGAWRLLPGTTLPVSAGGTGGVSFTADAVVCGGATTTGPLQTVAGLGTLGQVLTSQGAGALPQWAALATLVPAVDIRTASATITIPANATKLWVLLVGGGGGSGGASGGIISGSGGAAGVCVKYLSGLTPANTLALTIGTGGSAGTTTPTAGGNGGDTTLASGSQSITTLTAGKGLGGTTNGSSGNGAPGGGTNGDLNITGGNGFICGGVSGAIFARSGGTGLGFGPAQTATNGGTSAFSGLAGLGYGGGAAGAWANSGANVAGAAGAAGAAIFVWFA